MPPASTRVLKRWVAGFWSVNLLAAISLGLIWFTQEFPARQPSSLILVTTHTPSVFPIPSSTGSLPPTHTSLPERSPTPSPAVSTGIPATQTETPTPFSQGPIQIGASVEKRPLDVYRFGSGQDERLIVAGMHGGSEYNTVQLAKEMIAHLQTHPELIPPGISLYILEDLNPDGVARALNYLGRANAHAVDLNRNWNANWQKDWPRAGCWTQTEVSGGSVAMSEPETKALAAFIDDHHFSALINYHSAALGIFPGGLPPSEASIRLAEAVAAVSTYPYPPINTGCVYTGDFTDWADARGMAALNVELSDHSHTDFEMNLKILEVFLNWQP